MRRKIICLALAAFLFFQPHPCDAEITSKSAIAVILTEAADQPFQCMLAVAEILRLRGTPTDFSGWHRQDRDDFVQNQPQNVWNLAWTAWNFSQTSKISEGATHFEAIEFLRLRGWPSGWGPRKNFIFIKIIGDHVFFREIGFAAKTARRKSK